MEKDTIPAPPPATLTPLEDALAQMNGERFEAERLRARVAELEAKVEDLEADLMDAGLALLAGLPGGIKAAS